ncbi:MAG: CapA family protein [Oscillospiraceae bacterium]
MTAAALAAAVAAALWAAVIVLNPGVMRCFRREVVISIAGDVLLDRKVGETMREYGEFYPFQAISDLFGNDDITIANLECPLTAAGGTAMKGKQFVFKADPGSAAVLKQAGFDALMLANNHTMDYLSAGLSDTMDALSEAGILYAGAGENDYDGKPCFIEKNGVRIGILAYSSLPPEGFMHDSGSATIMYARAGFLDDMKKEVSEAARRCDFLIVYFHWGTEFRHDASDSQVEIARAAADSGARAVFGTHPHVLQGREVYNGVPIYYSVGNFVFDKQIPEGTDESLIVRLSVNKSGIVSLEELPVVIENCRPALAEGEKAAKIRSDLARYSRRFGEFSFGK